jgi:hypothetical protein
VIALISGLAYMFIPLTRVVLNALTAYPYMALVKYGPVYTILSFFFFGMLGGSLGYGLYAVKKSINKTEY